MTYAEILEDYKDEIEASKGSFDVADDESPGRFVLVQRNVGGYTPPIWLTTHATVQDAVKYIEGDEYAEDWETELLHDTETGEDWHAETMMVPEVSLTGPHKRTAEVEKKDGR